jgi:group II intron reverse transcriptase/maturase
MESHRKSDRVVVPKKRPNNTQGRVAEAVEGRTLTKGNTDEQATPRMQSRAQGVPSGLERVREAASRNREEKFTALLHHVDEEALLRVFKGMNRNAAAGVDGVTWKQYEEGLAERLQALCTRIHRGAYRPQPSRRTYIPKEDGTQRALGIAALEDKIVQGAVAAVLSAIYEVDFLGFSYGFRPGRGQHDALDALSVAIQSKKVNYILDADIRGYFDTIDHATLLQLVQERVRDPRVLQLIERWLKAGVMEEGRWKASETGTPQGATISPLLANIMLHHVLDRWAHAWRQKNARGEVIIVRYADDFIVGFQYEQDAKAFQEALQARLREHLLELHPDKTRLIEFGRFARERRSKRGEGKPQTFNFLGFTHICAWGPKGFWVKRIPKKERVRAKLRKLKEALRRNMHRPVPLLGAWLKNVLIGYYAYFAVPGALWPLHKMRKQLGYFWFKALRRRDQKRTLNWERMRSIVDTWLPQPRLTHPIPAERFFVRNPR